MAKVREKQVKTVKEVVVWGRNSFNPVGDETLVEARRRKIADDKRWERALGKAVKDSVRLREQEEARIARNKNKRNKGAS